MQNSQDRLSPNLRIAGRRSAPPEAAGLPMRSLVNAVLDRIEGDKGTSGPVDTRTATLLGLLASEIDLEYSDKFKNRFGLARSWVPLVEKHPDIATREWRGALALELGCGALNPLGSVAELIARGVRVCSLDLDELPSTVLSARSAYWLLLDHAARLGMDLPRSIDLHRLRQGYLDAIPSDVWRFVQASADRTGLEDTSVDLCVSNSFLEHVPDPTAVVREAARITSPGGLAFHRIDFRDHRSYRDSSSHPLDFLTLNEPDGGLVRGCNRWRHSDFVELFTAAGFEIRHIDLIENIEIDESLRERLAPRFRDYDSDDLSRLFVGYYLRRSSE